MIKCTFEDGVRANLRHIVVDALVIKENKVLLVRRSADSHEEPNKLALPGGFIDMDETAEDAVKREVLEETGYRAKIKKFIKYIDNPKRSERQNVTLLFLLEAEEKIGEPDNEVSEVIWVPLENLPEKEELGFDHYEILADFKKTEKFDLTG